MAGMKKNLCPMEEALLDALQPIFLTPTPPPASCVPPLPTPLPRSPPSLPSLQPDTTSQIQSSGASLWLAVLSIGTFIVAMALWKHPSVPNALTFLKPFLPLVLLAVLLWRFRYFFLPVSCCLREWLRS